MKCLYQNRIFLHPLALGRAFIRRLRLYQYRILLITSLGPVSFVLQAAFIKIVLFLPPVFFGHTDARLPTSALY